MRQMIRHLMLAGCVAALAGCMFVRQEKASPAAAMGPKVVKPAGTVLEGTITYRARVALAPDAVVKVWLQDMSRPGLPVPEILDEQVIRGPVAVPIPFAVRYDPAAIDAGHTYTLLVHIYEGDRTRFVNAKPFPVITRGCIDRCEVVVDLMN